MNFYIGSVTHTDPTIYLFSSQELEHRSPVSYAVVKLRKTVIRI